MVHLSYKVNSYVKYMQVACEFLTSMPWLLAIIIVKHMDIISKVLVRLTTGNLIKTDGPCLLGHRMKIGEDSMYMQICS